MNIHPNQPLSLCCPRCLNTSFETEIFSASIFFRCSSCKLFQQHLFENLSRGTFNPIKVSAPQQEPAVQVPATAPAAGHLSTQHSDTRLDVDPLAPSDCIFAQCSKCTSKFFAPAVAFGQLLLVCENCETGFAFADPVNTWPQADQCHIPDLSTDIVNK